MKKEDVFSLEELYFICSVVGVKKIVGLPDLSMFKMMRQETSQEAVKQMKAKGIFAEDGKLTMVGGSVLNYFKQYALSEKHIVINGDFIAFNNHKLIILSSPDQEGVQMEITTKEAYFRQLYENIAMIRREATEEEATFFKKLVPRSEREALNQLPTTGGMLLKKIIKEQEETWFIKMHEDKLYGYHETRVYQLSQYWFIKWLLDGLEIPIIKEEVKQQ